MDFQKVQELYNNSICFFPDCTSRYSRAPTRQRDNIHNLLHQHLKLYHNSPKENSIKLGLIGKLTKKYYKHEEGKLV
jgi:hypothetical protein